MSMRRDLAIVAGITCILAPGFAFAANPALPIPSAEDRAVYERGQALGRVILIQQDPRIYGIVPLQSRIDADFAVMESDPLLGGQVADRRKFYAPMQAYFKTGEMTKAAAAFGEFNSFRPFAGGPDPAHPLESWLMEAGMSEVAIRGADDNMVFQLLALDHPMWVARHASVAGGLGTLVPPIDIDRLPKEGPITSAAGQSKQSLDLTALRAFQTNLAANLDAAFGQSAYPAFKYAQSRVGLAQLGVSTACLAELAEHRALLSQPDSQLFADAAFAQFTTYVRDQDRNQAAHLRSLYRVDANFDPRAVFSSGGEFMDLLASQPLENKGAFLLGNLTEQAAYNAFVLRDQKDDREYRSVIESLSSVDSQIPGLRELRMNLAAVAAGDWQSSQRAASAIVMKILGAGR